MDACPANGGVFLKGLEEAAEMLARR